MHAAGEFEVDLNPQPDGHFEAGRMTLDKRYFGDLDATGKGQMLSHRPGVTGAGGYVAIEQVSGDLRGRKGTFVLQHSGTMNDGQQQLSIHVVPHSGTGELTGLIGTMEIIIEQGKHYYQFDYELPENAE